MLMSVKVGVAALGLGLCTLLSCASLAMPSWVVGKINGTYISIGLYRACCDITCVSIFSDKECIIKAIGGDSNFDGILFLSRYIQNASSMDNQHFSVHDYMICSLFLFFYNYVHHSLLHYFIFLQPIVFTYTNTIYNRNKKAYLILTACLLFTQN